LEEPVTRVLVVDDFEPWRQFTGSRLQERPTLQVVGEAGDGAEAVRKAQELQPDLILLDIGLPSLNGIQAARQIRDLSPKSKIIFLTAIRSRDFAGEAMRTGASGYVIKSAAREELLPAIEAVLQGRLFLSAGLDEDHRTESISGHKTHSAEVENIAPSIPSSKEDTDGQHEVGFYPDEGSFLDHVAHFVGTALKSGTSAIVVATAAHREALLRRLQIDGLEIHAAIEQGRYIAVDAAKAVSSFMVDGMPDAGLFLKCFGDLIVSASKAAHATTGEQGRVAVFGEGVQVLWAQGNAEAAIQVEKLGNELLKIHNVEILCAYSTDAVPGGMDDLTFQCVCAEHSVVHGRELSR